MLWINECVNYIFLTFMCFQTAEAFGRLLLGKMWFAAYSLLESMSTFWFVIFSLSFYVFLCATRNIDYSRKLKNVSTSLGVFCLVNLVSGLTKNYVSKTWVHMSIAEKPFWIKTWLGSAGNLGRAVMAKQPYNRNKMENICVFLDTLR